MIASESLHHFTTAPTPASGDRVARPLVIEARCAPLGSLQADSVEVDIFGGLSRRAVRLFPQLSGLLTHLQSPKPD